MLHKCTYTLTLYRIALTQYSTIRGTNSFKTIYLETSSSSSSTSCYMLVYISYIVQLYVVLVWCTVISILCIIIIQRKKGCFIAFFSKSWVYSKLITRGDGKHRAHTYIYRTEQNTSKKICCITAVMNRECIFILLLTHFVENFQGIRKFKKISFQMYILSSDKQL